MRPFQAATVATLLSVGCVPYGTTVTSPPTSPVTVGYGGLPAGTELFVELEQPLGLRYSRVGQRFSARVMQPVLDPAGQTLVPRGAQVTGYVADLRGAGYGQPAVISMQLEELQVYDRVLPIEARVVGTDIEAPRHGVRPEYLLGGGAGGAILGGILGGGRGAVAGALVGAGAGTLISLGLDQQRAALPAGTALAIRLTRPIPAEVLRPY